MKGDSAKVDAYIARAAPFARPILLRVRRAFHDGCPGIEERIKWGVPSFEKRGLVGGIAAFKAHATFGFWRGSELEDRSGHLKGKRRRSFMDEKLTHVSQLPPHRILVDYVRRAVALNEAGPPKRAAARRAKPAPKTPADLLSALARNAKARRTWDGFPPGQKREYVLWLTESRQAATRARRLATTVEWLSMGRRRNWKYDRR